MKYSSQSLLSFNLIILFSLLLSSCDQKQAVQVQKEKPDQELLEKSFEEAMQRHLDAVTNKDLATLKSTMAPHGKLHFMLVQRETSHTADEFMKFHEGWFEDTNWTFETKITKTEVGPKYGLAITEITYREPERNGKPYFNRMAVSYVQEYIDGKWYVIKDHATSTEKGS